MAYEWGTERFGVTVVKEQALFPPTVRGVFIDVETTETTPREVVGACVYAPEFEPKKIYWFDKSNISAVKELALKHGVRGHNVKFDIRALFSFDEKWPEVIDDTMILAYSYSSVLPAYGLKDLAGTNCSIVWPKYRDIVGKGRAKKTLDKQPEDLVMSYCGMDVYATSQLFEVLCKKLTPATSSHYYDLELPTYKSLMQMEKRGIAVDVDRLTALKAEWEKEAKENYDLLRATYGDDFNPGSPKQVLNRMFVKLNIPESSTDKRVLRLYKTVPDIKILLAYRTSQKLVTTYADALLSRAPAVHCTFNQIAFDEHAEADATAIKTTRLSSSDPNLQNIPARSADGKKVRQTFVSRPGFKFLVADYSQIEYRLLAHLSEDPVLLDAYAKGIDIHKQTASILFKIGVDEVTDAQRDLAKTINFASIYGAAAKKIAGLTDRTPDECQQFLNIYFDKLPGVRRFVQLTKVKAHLTGYTETMLGRRIELPDIKSTDRFTVFSAERKAVNYKVQGSAAEIMKVALCRLEDFGYSGLLTVHDEFVIELPESADEVAVENDVQHVLCDGWDLKVPLEAKIGFGHTWGDAKK